jgi:thiamine biosynthesis lipoprotein ApbE
MVGSTVSVAAWSKDSAALESAIARMRAATQGADSTTARAGARIAWSTERGDAPLRIEPRDVADSYELDRAVPLLASAADSALIDLGGLFLWVGPETKRSVGIADPGNALDPAAGVELRSGAISTVAGRGERRAITVLAPTAFKAAAWSSALFSLGCEKALAEAQRRGISVVCADSAGVRWSPELQNRVVLPPGRAP